MFANSLLESNWVRSHRGWTTLASFGLQTLGIAMLLVLPLIYTEGLPRLHLLSVSAPLGPLIRRAIISGDVVDVSLIEIRFSSVVSPAGGSFSSTGITVG